MNDQQRADLNSYLALRDIHQTDAHRALWSSLSAYVLLHDRFLAKISYINACLLIQSTDTTGITQAKKDARQKDIASTFEIAGLLSTYGFLTGNKDLETRGDLVISDLARLDDIALDTEGNAFLDLPATKVNDIAPDDLGLTPGKLDLPETRLETFNLLLGSPRTARGTKTAATANLQSGLDEAEEILKKGLDKLVYQFRDTDFYKEYQSAKKSINTAIRREKPDDTNSSDHTNPSVQP